MYLRLIFVLWVVFYVCFSLAVTFSKLSFDKQKFPTNDPNSLAQVQLAFQTKYSEVVFNMSSCFTFIRYRKRHLKRRFRYGSNHPGSYNPTLITNQEAQMVNRNTWIDKALKAEPRNKRIGKVARKALWKFQTISRRPLWRVMVSNLY